MNTEDDSRRSRALVLGAFAVIYLVWGSTYLAIRVAIETLPPFFSASVRFLVAGSLMWWVLTLRGVPGLTRDQWRFAAITGALMIVAGNGFVVWALQSVDSGFAALLIALMPMWFAVIDWVRPGGQRPQPRTVLGIATGFAGMALLVRARGGAAFEAAALFGSLAILVSSLAWASGSIYARERSTGASPWRMAAAQMICGGMGQMAVACALGEPFRLDWSAISLRSMAGLAYLVVFGSWIAYSAYVWLLKHTTPTRLSTYAYVNPVVAMLLGSVFLGEKVTAGMLLAAGVILCGVVVITLPAGVWRGAGRHARWLWKFVKPARLP